MPYLILPANDTTCNCKTGVRNCCPRKHQTSDDDVYWVGENWILPSGTSPAGVLSPFSGIDADCSRRDHVSNLRLVIAPELLSITTQPGLNLIKAWADVLHSLSVSAPSTSVELPALRLRDLMWDSTGEQGVLTDFDLEVSSNDKLDNAGQGTFVVDLLESKAICDSRATRLARDTFEPYAWMLISAHWMQMLF
ncbi:hypothetical protein LshimejAT787_0705710 [Lyophyllum shimeji]|uniref:Uncharacterized protein n=1 Tax=Lyophyllum shimeji TaxID=47721 RepID=A0A9P3URB4_LYOSH|nr:hypothetical protein LshimejAT787_0705710 [Lyophyllum shimeji]